MNYTDRYLREIANYRDVVLADVAVRIQLSPIGRRASPRDPRMDRTLRYPLFGLVLDLYTQLVERVGAEGVTHLFARVTADRDPLSSGTKRCKKALRCQWRQKDITSRRKHPANLTVTKIVSRA
jgi:hypothetical protein